MNTIMSKESMNNLNIDEFVNWKNTKRNDTKLTDSELDIYLKKRQEEQEKIFDEVETGLASSSKRKEVEKFLKTKHLSEDVERYYDNLNENDTNTDKNKKTSKSDKSDKSDKSVKSDKSDKFQSSNLDDMLSYMEKIRAEEFADEQPKTFVKPDKSGESDFSDLKSNRELPKINNVRKREFK